MIIHIHIFIKIKNYISILFQSLFNFFQREIFDANYFKKERERERKRERGKEEKKSPIEIYIFIFRYKYTKRREKLENF